MKPGDIILCELSQENNYKLRPGVILKIVPPHGRFLVCGITSKIQDEIVGFEEPLLSSDPNFTQWGLRTDSLLQPAYLGLLARNQIKGKLGEISPERLARIQSYLARFIESD